MKNIHFFSLIIICFPGGANMSVFAEDKSNKGRQGSTYTTFNLSDEERVVLEKKSLDGDAAASFRLSQYYALSNYNQEKELQYLEVAATQGHPVAQYNFGGRFSQKTGHYASWYDLDKAIYWLEKSANNGNEAAKRHLQELKIKINRRE